MADWYAESLDDACEHFRWLAGTGEEAAQAAGEDGPE